MQYPTLVLVVLAIAGCGKFGRGTAGGSGGATASFGVLTGHLTFSPPLLDARIATVEAASGGDTTPGTVSSNGDYVIYPLVAGTYSVTGICPGFGDASVVGVTVTDGADAQVPELTLTGDTDGGGPGGPGQSADGG